MSLAQGQGHRATGVKALSNSSVTSHRMGKENAYMSIDTSPGTNTPYSTKGFCPAGSEHYNEGGGWVALKERQVGRDPNIVSTAK